MLEDMTLHRQADWPASTHDAQGHIELERSIDSIIVGNRHRTELGDLQPLMDSIKHLGLLQPITVTPDGLLICGRRRLEAVTRLDWRTVRVWVRVGISDNLARLVAEQDENATHKPLSPIEAARLFREMRELMREDAARRQHATRFGAPSAEPAGVGSGSGESPEPASRHARESRVQAAKFVTQRDSHQQLERICEMERLAADRAQPAAVRQVAEDELGVIRNGGPVNPGWQRVRAVMDFEAQRHPAHLEADLATESHDVLAAARKDRARRIKENRQKRASAAANAARSMRSFTLTWAELLGWSRHYDPARAARELSDDDWALFLSVIEETRAFAETVTRERQRLAFRSATRLDVREGRRL